MTEENQAKERTPVECPHFYKQNQADKELSSTVCNSVPISSIALSHCILFRESTIFMKMG